jgi:hypothetical protein
VVSHRGEPELFWLRKAQSLCATCQSRSKQSARKVPGVILTVADKLVPHRGDPELFWGGDLQSLCATCPSPRKQSEEKGGSKHLAGCGPDGGTDP